MEAGLSEILGNVCEAVGRYVERVSGHIGEVRSARFDPYKVSDLIAEHGGMFRGTVDAGSFRTSEARVMHGAQVAFVPPPPSAARRLTDELFEWLEAPGEHPLVSFAIFHYQLLYIHPFTDGNGRIARLWHAALMGKWRPALAGFRMEESVAREKADYLQALERSDRRKDAAPFVIFMLKLIGCELEGMIESTLAVASRDPKTPERLSDFLERLLAVFKGRTLTGAEIMAGLGMSHRGTFRKNYLDPAIEAGYVEMTQPDSPRSPTQKYRLTHLGGGVAGRIE
jgi:fido (protein-threonine AMPylation protein)